MKNRIKGSGRRAQFLPPQGRVLSTSSSSPTVTGAISTHGSMSENELYEIVADLGEFQGIALRRDSHLVRSIDWPDNWLEIADDIGEARAETLRIGTATPSDAELRRLIRWQIDRALDDQNPEITPSIWFCRNDDEEILAVEGWGNDLRTFLRFRCIGCYPNEISARQALAAFYIFSSDDL